MKKIHLDEIRPGRPEGVDWLPLRAELGITAFGASAYRADTGETVVPPHSESGGGAGVHEELYVVLRGRARFTVGEETFDAPPGTCVLVLPGERRSAKAEEPGTELLVIGAPAGKAYRIAPWEYGSRAARAAQLLDVDELERVAGEGVAVHGEHVTMLYAQACVAAQRGRHEEALELVGRAAQDEEFGGWVRDNASAEPLLEPVRDDPRFPT
ncbi:MAG: AraC family ligand binding domain-containing protein [Gaiellaceae bacterium]